MAGVNGCSLEEEVCGGRGAPQPPQRRHLQRIISIEEDHLPYLLQEDYHAELRDWREEEEEEGVEAEEEEEEEEEEETDLEMTIVGPASQDEQQWHGKEEGRGERAAPTSPRGQPVGKETVQNVSMRHWIHYTQIGRASCRERV